MMSFYDVSVFFDVFGDSRDGSGFFVIDGFIKLSECFFDFWLDGSIPRSSVWMVFSSLEGWLSAVGCSFESFSISISKNI